MIDFFDYVGIFGIGYELEITLAVRLIRRTERRKITLSLRVREDGEEVGRRRDVIAQPLIIGEEEQFVFDDRAAEAAAELIPALFGLPCAGEIVAPVVGVQHVVAEELEAAAVKLIRARFDGHADDAALEGAEFR